MVMLVLICLWAALLVRRRVNYRNGHGYEPDGFNERRDI